MLEENRENFHYRVFKSVINKFNWSIPTQVVLYNEKKLKNPNLTKFTNILCQIWAKKDNEYIFVTSVLFLIL